MLSQQRHIVELRDLQLQQERESVRTLRASLRDEQRTKRDLEGQYEAINSELLVRNTREAIAESRMSELERELSELNVSLNSSRSENERLVQDIHQVRYVTVFCTLPKNVLDQSCYIRTWNTLTDTLDLSTDLRSFKTILKSCYFTALETSYDCEDPRTFKTICSRRNRAKTFHCLDKLLFLVS